MRIKDKIYGEFDISEQVLVDLINSKAMQRLKGISQQGLPATHYNRLTHSRFEHSMGVFLLLRKLGAGLEEQISGLLHDVSHTAFSHVIDVLWGDPSIQDFQDKKHLEVLESSDVKGILEKYNFDIKKIADCEQFGLLERDLPDLCADRLDYTLQEVLLRGDSTLAKELANHLVVYKNGIIFNNLELTKTFSKIYLKFNRKYWAGFESVTRYYQLASILRDALDKNIINKKDVWEDDKYVLDKIYKSKDQDLTNRLEMLKDKVTTVRFNVVQPKKSRYVDPEILIDNKLTRLSLLDKDYAALLESEREKSTKDMII